MNGLSNTTVLLFKIKNNDNNAIELDNDNNKKEFLMNFNPYYLYSNTIRNLIYFAKLNKDTEFDNLLE